MYPISVPRVSPFPATDCRYLLFPRPGTSFGESVLLLFGERSATASDWGVECHPSRAENTCHSKVCAQGCWQLNCFPGFATEAVENLISPHVPIFPPFPSLKNIEKNMSMDVNGHSLRYPMVSPGTYPPRKNQRWILWQRRCSCIRNGRNASPVPQGCGAKKQSLDATSAFRRVDPIKDDVVYVNPIIYTSIYIYTIPIYTNLYQYIPSLLTRNGFYEPSKIFQHGLFVIGFSLVFQIIRPEILSL